MTNVKYINRTLDLHTPDGKLLNSNDAKQMVTILVGSV